MNLYLSRQSNGLYMLTKFMPIKCKVYGNDKEDLYIVQGEPIGIRNMCGYICKVLRREELQPLQTIQITMQANEL